MKKKILVFSNGEKLGDGIIKLPFLHEIKNRLPNHELIWVTILIMGLLGLAFDILMRLIIGRTIPWRGKG